MWNGVTKGAKFQEGSFSLEDIHGVSKAKGVGSAERSVLGICYWVVKGHATKAQTSTKLTNKVVGS